ncbi:beta-lactamase [Penicillium angulare]|uniref:beta-lactamase n=1 Tax=Penicillium angulare TaxID=116970 RepID=UPI00253F834A|nr:beta-lactamase [Penicillium angulare]KAJ5272593.1 beta-lactamase [Penicillium angulare]
MVEVHGSCDPYFNSVRDLLQQKLADGDEVGASICVKIDGKDIVDFWGGHIDESHIKPWGKDTITAPEFGVNVKKSTPETCGAGSLVTPGSHSAYQVTNYGHMVGELIRWVRGKPVTQFITEEITKPLDVDYKLGIGPSR